MVLETVKCLIYNLETALNIEQQTKSYLQVETREIPHFHQSKYIVQCKLFVFDGCIFQCEYKKKKKPSATD